MQDPKIRHLGTIAQLCRAISSQLRHVSTIGEKLVKQQYLPRMSLRYDELGLLAAEIGLPVWGTQAIFNGFSRLGSVAARHSSGRRQPNCGIEQRAPPIFSRAAITLGIGSYSSYKTIFLLRDTQCRRICISRYML